MSASECQRDSPAQPRVAVGHSPAADVVLEAVGEFLLLLHLARLPRFPRLGRLRVVSDSRFLVAVTAAQEVGEMVLVGLIRS